MGTNNFFTLYSDMFDFLVDNLSWMEIYIIAICSKLFNKRR